MSAEQRKELLESAVKYLNACKEINEIDLLTLRELRKSACANNTKVCL